MRASERVDRDEVFLEVTRSICPVCKRVLDAEVNARDDQVFLRKRCPEHGSFEARVYGDGPMVRSTETDPVPTGSEMPAAVRPRRSAFFGAIAGLIGIGCCVYPTVLVLLGLSSAAAAVDLANGLFDDWGWAFKLAGAAFALIALWIQRRRARACRAGARPTLRSNALWIAAIAVATYAVFYGLTTWLGSIAT